MALTELTSDAVLQAVAAYDDLGRDALLAKHGLATTTASVLLHDGEEYDTTAIVLEAHHFATGGALPSPLTDDERATRVLALINLGFTVRDTSVSDSARAWLVASKLDYRRLGGGSVYDDVVETHYSWDSNVANSKQIKAGDLIAIWDESELVGFSVIESIDLSRGRKRMGRCPNCANINVARRKKARPRYRCEKCNATFGTPAYTEKMVDRFRSTHGQAWTVPMPSLGRKDLMKLCVHDYSQNSIRELRSVEFRNAIDEVALGSPMAVVDAAVRQIRGGHVERLVRARLGQATFRSRLVLAHGLVCAFTGPAPGPALEAAHLYSYASQGQHRDNGGLLMRRDIHALFDRGLLAVGSDNCIKVSPQIGSYSAYCALDGAPLRVATTVEQNDWLATHFRQWEHLFASSTPHPEESGH
ncbi:HNH endonuclease [Rhodococcus sp. ARC_M12]|uniref:HNH endonuclease n=1 Tax=Rhodococcus sp. ARC_M12 TaxID=2928854 RepID=UPI001FB388E3|nr:HNH endonuclease signature motif containing protein [Rhodococcus sp. ARC_M12]MCJ0980939.1 HNH endonuclease [Rhodococcus sp. ARC_M12]